MSRHVLTLNLKGDPGTVDLYRRHHDNLWPEVRESLLRAGVQRLDIYLLGRRLVMIVEVPDHLDYQQVFAAHARSSPRVVEWERLMASLQEPVSDARAGEWWAVMEPVFHLEEQEPSIAHIPDRARAS